MWFTVISLYSDIIASYPSVETASRNARTTHYTNSPGIMKMKGQSQFKK